MNSNVPRLPTFDAARVLVAGDVMLDRYWSGAVNRISPEAPVPVVRVLSDTVRAGGASNVAVNIAALGGSASLLGVVGNDENAGLLAEILGKSGVTVRWVNGSAPTITKLRLMAQNQQLLRADFEDPLHANTFDVAGYSQQFNSALLADGVKAAVLSDYGKGTLNDSASLIAHARAAGIPVLVDPKGADWRKYAGATLITPNMSEFTLVVGAVANERELVAKAEQLMADLSLQAMLVTRSEHGMTLVQRGRPPLHIASQAREVFDVTGAGDTVIAVLAAALAAGESLPDSSYIANCAAGVVVGKLGTSTVSPVELSAALGLSSVTRGLSDLPSLQRIVSDAQSHGKKVVMTNGCFDLLHAGHVRYLEEARALGDLLIVAVNTDDSVRALKGPSRPINPCEARMAVINGLKAVDYVIPFAEDTPESLIKALLPNILVKGGDYTEDQIAGGAAVKAAGGSVKVLKFLDGYSSSSIIRRCIESAEK